MKLETIKDWIKNLLRKPKIDLKVIERVFPKIILEPADVKMLRVVAEEAGIPFTADTEGEKKIKDLESRIERNKQWEIDVHQNIENEIEIYQELIRQLQTACDNRIKEIKYESRQDEVHIYRLKKIFGG